MIGIGSLVRTWNAQNSKQVSVLGVIISSDLYGRHDDKYTVFKIMTSDGNLIERPSFQVDEVKV